jgi:hypothetical protein
MDLGSQNQRFRGLLSNIGKAGLNAQFPNDFELYIVALELVNGNGDTEDYFVFPIMPNSITESISPSINIKKTFAGVAVQKTNTYVPTDITLNGNFGKKLKFLINQDLISFTGLRITPNGLKNAFSDRIKTGYGCYKLLERICAKSQSLDLVYKKPYSLYFYNLALGNNYLVEVMNITPNQTLNSNMMWEYSLQLKSLSRIEDLKSRKQNQVKNFLSSKSILQDNANKVLGVTRYFLKL